MVGGSEKKNLIQTFVEFSWTKMQSDKFSGEEVTEGTERGGGADKQTTTTGRGGGREGGGTHREEEVERENSNSKTSFSKDCSLGSFRPV